MNNHLMMLTATTLADRIKGVSDPISVTAAGYDEHWIQDWLAEEPSRLELGDLHLDAQEMHYGDAGNLDLLASNGDRVYAVEVQLGEADTSHGFRVFDYWARNRRRQPEKTHVAVLVCESAQGRYRAALEALAEHLPLIVIEARGHESADEGFQLKLVPVIANTSLDVDTAPLVPPAEERTRDDWRTEATGQAWRAFEEFERFAAERLHPSIYCDYTLRSRISFRYRRTLWATARPIRAGITVALPDPDRITGGDPSGAFDYFTEAVARSGVTLSWQPSNNAGAQPILLTLREGDIYASEVDALVRASWNVLDGDEPSYSERWGPLRREPPGYSLGPEWRGDFDPYYAGDYREGPDHQSVYAVVEYYGDHDDFDIFFSTPDLDWGESEEKREFVRRILIHHLRRKPTAKQINALMNGPAKEWEEGQLWSLYEADLAELLWAEG